MTLRLVEPTAYPAVPGLRAGNLIFEIEAIDASGVRLSPLPAEVKVSVQYTDAEVAGLNEALITMSRLDPFDAQQPWKTVPTATPDPATNSVTASTAETGVFAVHVP